MTLIGSTKIKITEDKCGKNVPHLEITETTLANRNIINNDYQHDCRVLYTLKSFGQLLEISSKNMYF